MCCPRYLSCSGASLSATGVIGYYDLVYRGERITSNDFELEVLDSYKEIVATCERILQGHGDL